MSQPDPELAAALAAIAEGPGDESARRVLGDLLLERGDPRGEFLLLQFLIAENQASAGMRARADELWRVHKRAWLAGVERLLEDLVVHFGFPVSATLKRHVRPADLVEAVRSPMFVTLKRLRGAFEGGAIVDALASPRLRELKAVALRLEADLAAAAERAVAGRLTEVELEFPLRRDAVQWFLQSPAFSSLERLVARTTEAHRYSRYSRYGAGVDRHEVVAVAPLTEALGGHPALRRLVLAGDAFGDPDAFLELAPLWPRLPRLERLEVPGCFELIRDEGVETLVLLNLEVDRMVALRPRVPPGVSRVRLMPRHDGLRGGRERLLAAFAGLDPKFLP